jgi:hypothetical protein
MTPPAALPVRALPTRGNGFRSGQPEAMGSRNVTYGLGLAESEPIASTPSRAEPMTSATPERNP